MTDRPNIKPGDWIIVGTQHCVVSEVREPGDPFGDCEVVFNRSKPTNHDIDWAGGEWCFVDRPDFGGYADKSKRLRRFVTQLKEGYK